MKTINQTRIEDFQDSPVLIFPAFEQCLRAMRWVHRQKRTPRPQNLYISGTTGMGKTTLIRHFIRSEGLLMDSRGYVVASQGRADVLSMDMTGLMNDKSLHRIITSAALGGADIEVPPAEEGANSYLQSLKVKTLILDEFSDVRRHTLSAQTGYMSHIRNICNQHQIGFITLGIYDIDAAFGADPHLEKRFNHQKLSNWKATQNLRDFVKSIAITMPLKRGMDVDNLEFFHVLLRHSEGTTSKLVSLLRGAATHAVLTGHERLDLEMLKAHIVDPFPEGCDGSPQ